MDESHVDIGFDKRCTKCHNTGSCWSTLFTPSGAGEVSEVINVFHQGICSTCALPWTTLHTEVTRLREKVAIVDEFRREIEEQKRQCEVMCENVKQLRREHEHDQQKLLELSEEISNKRKRAHGEEGEILIGFSVAEKKKCSTCQETKEASGFISKYYTTDTEGNKTASTSMRTECNACRAKKCRDKKKQKIDV